MIRCSFGFLLALFLAGGCGTTTPVGVTSLGRNYGYEQIDTSALNGRAYSSFTAEVLHRYDLERLHRQAPAQCLVQLHAKACGDPRRDTLFALSELAFRQAQRGVGGSVGNRRLDARSYYAAAVVYAYLYLTGFDANGVDLAFDRRFRIASDLYNRSLGYIVALREAPQAGRETVLELPVGQLRVRDGHSDFPKPLAEYERVISADRFKIHGLSVRNRASGMGAPLIILDEASGKKSPMPSTSAATLFISFKGGLAELTQGSLVCEVNVYSAERSHVKTSGGTEVPLETDLTTPLAYALDNPLYWRFSKALFRLGQGAFDPGIYPSTAYRPGKIPILWVHGTMSSPVWWSEMWNTLLGDPALRENYQHWFYLYDSAKPIAMSALQLRQAIQALVRQLDPAGKDPALRQMVVVGHSQGGLLTKLTATETGDALVRAATGKSLAELRLAPDEERLVRDLVVLEPLPEVRRVVFISTPHRGSFLANGLARRLGRWLIRLPQHAVQTTGELMRIVPKTGAHVQLATTSFDSMAPDNPGMLALAEIPVRPPIRAHSIIAVKGDAQPPEGDDGVVAYRSAHIEGVDSELVVRHGHSCQGHPRAIEEVRRILLEHLRAQAPPK